jgi:hypothetical protein
LFTNRIANIATTAIAAGGKTGAGIGGEIMDNTDLSAHQAAVFVVEAASAYCPGFLDQVTA